MNSQQDLSTLQHTVAQYLCPAAPHSAEAKQQPTCGALTFYNAVNFYRAGQ